VDGEAQNPPPQQIAKWGGGAMRGKSQEEPAANPAPAYWDENSEPPDNPALDRGGGWGSGHSLGVSPRRFGGSMGASLIAKG
ncbi:hypothetical protein B1F68_20885, partial [Pseudomonas syringae]